MPGTCPKAATYTDGPKRSIVWIKAAKEVAKPHAGSSRAPHQMTPEDEIYYIELTQGSSDHDHLNLPLPINPYYSMY